MMRSFLQTGFRNFWKYKLYTFINLAGLSLGLCLVVGIFLYVTDELSFDRFHDHGGDIYRINVTSRYNGNETRYSTTAATLVEYMRGNVPEVTHAGRLFRRQSSIGLTGKKDDSDMSKKFREDNLFLADPEIFNVFSFKFLKGEASTALKNPNQAVISERIAEKYFGSQTGVVGKELLFEGSIPVVVSAVIEDFPEQSHIHPDLILHFENFYTLETEEVREYLHKDWIYNPITTYIVIKPGTDLTAAYKKINSLQKKYGDERAAESITYELQPLHDIHLYSDLTYEESSNIRYVYILSSVGIIILIITCINFINLSTVHSLKRSREIGVRKVLGADKSGLILQFLGESSVVFCVAVLLSLLLLYTLLPVLNQISGKVLQFDFLFQTKILGGILAIFLVTAFLAGLYPSFYITRFKPAEVLKGISSNTTNEGYWLRKTLVVLQFSILVVLMSLAFLFHQQMTYVQNKPLGFQKNNILTIPLFSDNATSVLGSGVDGALRARMNSFELEVIKNSGAEAVTVSSGYPGSGVVSALVQTDQIKGEDNVFIAATSVDYDFLDTYKIELVSGRTFSREAGTDHLQAFVINERAAKQLGWTASEAIGQRFTMLGKEGSVIGVVRDFHFQGLQQTLQPLILEVAASKFTIFSLRLNPASSLAQSVDVIKAAWGAIFPEKVFEYHFLNDRLQEAYGREQRLTQLMQVLSSLAILISALGLFGLAAYINRQRAKEVSIRKVFGANAHQIFAILGKEFLQMGLIGFTIGVPLAYFLGATWLDSFAYRISIGLLPFILGGMVLLVTVLISISYETIRTASVNPVDKLRNE
jgi:putative ABC transport system permease protein